MSVKERLLASAVSCVVIATVLLAGCATGRARSGAVQGASARPPDTVVALVPTDKRSDYGGHVIRTLYGQPYICRQREVLTKDGRYEAREVCSASSPLKELKASLTAWRYAPPARYWTESPPGPPLKFLYCGGVQCRP